MSDKIIEIKIKKDGTMDIDQIGFSGSSCGGAINDLLNKLGKEKETTKKKDYWKEDHIRIQEFE